MRKVKISEFDMRVVINGLNTMRPSYDLNKQLEVISVLSRLLDVHETMKPNKKKRILFESAEKQLIMHCLNDWRSAFLSEGKEPQAEQVGETMLLFIK